MEHIRQIDKFKSKNIEDIPSLLDLKKLLFYINKIEGYDKIDINILYSNIIILYIYNFFEIIKSIIETNSVDINIVDNNAAPALAPATPAVSSPVIETDDAILTRMKITYYKNIIKFNNIKSNKYAIYARFKAVIDDMSEVTANNYTQFDLKKYFLNLQRTNYISDIKTKLIKDIKDTISHLKTNGKLFNALYIDSLEEELKMFESLIDNWIRNINKIVA